MPLTQVQGGMLAGSTNTTTTIQSNGTTAITIDSSQRVGIGTTGPSFPLDISAASGTTARIKSTGDYSYLRLDNTSATGGGGLTCWQNGSQKALFGVTGSILGDTSGDAGVYAETGQGIRFYSNATERMRIDSSGRALFGSTDTNPVVNNNPGVAISAGNGNSYTTGVIQASATGNPALFLNRGADDGVTVQFRRSGTTVGSISVTTSSTSYNTSSDYRLKENIAPMTGALAKVAQLKPCTYTWKATGEAGEGFIAHELQAVVPDAVVGEKDAVNEDGSINPQGIDTSFLVATLTAAIQELKGIVDTQAAKIAELEAKVN